MRNKQLLNLPTILPESMTCRSVYRDVSKPNGLITNVFEKKFSEQKSNREIRFLNGGDS